MSVMKGCDGGVRCGVVCAGYLKKLKTSRKKYFVLRAETAETSARLEYYDSERKFTGGQTPKRIIPLKNCFNINRRLDTKYKHVIALYTKDDCFCVVMESEEELDRWLKALLQLQHGEEVVDGEAPKPTFEHVWQVTVLNRGLGTEGLTEVGRSSCLGPGELWMQTEDNNIAQNVHLTVFNAMGGVKEELPPKSRNRSSSATESSKPNNMPRKIHSNVQPKCHILTQGAGGGRERCDSMPSRARTASEGTHAMPPGWAQQPRPPHLNPPYRPASLYGRGDIVSHSPPSGGSPVSPPSVGCCSTDSAGSSYSLTDETTDPVVCAELLDPATTSLGGRFGHPLTPDEAIAEEECCPDSPTAYAAANYLPMVVQGSDDGYVDMSPRGRHHNNSPTASTSSVTSGTPSTDMRFAEYPLEKVTSYLASEDDDARPARAYSVGSKPECYKKYTDMLGQNSDNLRVRALSVGSKTKKLPSRVLPPHGYHQHQGAKSSSAPILSNARAQGSHNSIGPMDDLMEMDFSRSGSVNDSSYMDMRPASTKNHHGGYMEMKPGARKPDASPYVDMSQGSSPVKPSYISNLQSMEGLNHNATNDYMQMDPRKTQNNADNNNDYLPMSFKRPASNYQLSPAKASPLSSGYLDSHFGSPKTEPATPAGYVEMSLGRGHQRQSSLDNPLVAHEDYANMSMGKKRDRSTRKKEKARSQPIAIQNPAANAPKTSSGAGSSSPRYALLGRKFSTGTPPMHLPLNETTPYSSLPRQRRRDSKDSSSSSVTTPSSSSTIFPISLNSPCSPVKPDRTPPKKSESGDYTPMDFDRSGQVFDHAGSRSGQVSDYVNFNPKTTPVNENYAVMKPGVGTSPSARMAMMQLSDTLSFRPIDENKDDATQSERVEEVRPADPPYEILRARPSSVAESGRSSLSRPSSTSSELCSSGSTIVGGSRPESVNSDRVRPASVTSAADVQLHYASLDLEEGNRSPRTVKSEGQAEVTLTYAAIDFVKSEGLKHNSLPTNAKVKH